MVKIIDTKYLNTIQKIYTIDLILFFCKERKEVV